MIKLSICIGVLNQFDVARKAIELLSENLQYPEEVEIIAIDNGSDQEFTAPGAVKVVRNQANSGNYALFEQAASLAQGEIVAIIHSDVFIYEKGWDVKVCGVFSDNDDLGLAGFIGSTEIDLFGGRGMGTVSNMQGREVGEWRGSAAQIHGKRDEGFIKDGSVVDGCVMIFRKSVLESIPFREDYPPHHFYDRLFSCQVLQMGYKVGILGIPFDHISGQTANKEGKWQQTSSFWFKLHYGIDTPQQWAEIHKDWVNNPKNPSRGKVPDQWDYCSYLEAERLFLQEFRDQKHFIPTIYGKSAGIM